MKRNHTRRNGKVVAGAAKQGGKSHQKPAKHGGNGFLVRDSNEASGYRRGFHTGNN